MASENNTQSLRVLAAEASDGASADIIYALFQRAVLQHNLSGDLLDFGAGKGALTTYFSLSRRFRSVTAVDLMSRPAGLSKAIKWMSLDLNESIHASDATFDVIAAAEIIEHLENPRAIAREWYRLLRPGGTLLISTPNNESWRSILALIFRGHYAHFGEHSYPAHITPLLRKDMERILCEAGFSTPKFFYTNMGIVPKMPFLWQTISFGLLKGLRFSDNILAVAKKPDGSC